MFDDLISGAALLLYKIIPVRNSLYQEVITHIGLWLELRRVIIKNCAANKNETLDAAEKHYFLRSFQRTVSCICFTLSGTLCLLIN